MCSMAATRVSGRTLASVMICARLQMLSVDRPAPSDESAETPSGRSNSQARTEVPADWISDELAGRRTRRRSRG
jgi:hypothetical protein